jgi:hypothetical protein
MIKLYVSQLTDQFLQRNFRIIGDIFDASPFLRGEWRFMTFQIKATGSAVKIPHTLSYTPLDAIFLSVVGGTATFNYSSFDATYISINATVTASPMTIRAIIGRHSEEGVNV